MQGVSAGRVDTEATIVGLATPARAGGVRSILRWSGPVAHTLARGHARSPAGEAIDEGWFDRPVVGPVGWRVAVWGREVAARLYAWPAGRSYTGQPSCELHLPASLPLAAAIQQDLCDAGARLARPGEFTLRAFLHGRLDLVQAEGVLGLVEAEDLASLQRAIDQRAGGLSRPVTTLRDRLLDLLADLEAELDFVEEDITFADPERIAATLDEAAAELAALQGQSATRSLAEELPRVVLVGPANAGKSTLFNALVGRSAALVSDRAGTTRDFVRGVLELRPGDPGGPRCELIDTAGFDVAVDELDRAASTVRDVLGRDADLRLLCVPVGAPVPSGPASEFRSCESAAASILVRTKADLAATAASEGLAVSAATGGGLDVLRQRLGEVLLEARGKPIVSDRCREALATAAAEIDLARGVAADGLGHELLAVPLRAAIEALGEIAGVVYTEDLLGRIFSRFCIGK